MGTLGTKNWKLFTVLAISMMLIAGMCISAAYADGEGTITVEWDSDPTGDYNDVDEAYPEGADDPARPPLPLRAGSEANRIKFTYTVKTSMVGGLLDITIPDDWKLAGSVIIIDDQEIYNADGPAVDPATPDPGPAMDDDKERATVSATSIQVKLDSGWAQGGMLTIELQGVTVPVPTRLTHTPADPDADDNRLPSPYAISTFRTRSQSSATGDLERLSPTSVIPNPHPRVRVGNILGTRVVTSRAAGTATYDGGNDTIDRNVTIEPKVAYMGEEHSYEITFTALGPMYDSEIEITLPDDDVLERDGEKSIDDVIRLSAPGVDLGDAPAGVGKSVNIRAVAIDGDAVRIYIDEIDKDETVVLTYGPVTVRKADLTRGDSDTANSANPYSEFVVMTAIKSGGNQDPDADLDVAVTTVTDGVIGTVAGSGTLTVMDGSSNSAVAGDTISTLTLTYTASTDITAESLVIAVPHEIMASGETNTRDETTDDIVDTVSTFFLGTGTDYGYVTSPDSDGGLPIVVTPQSTPVLDPLDIPVEGTAISVTTVNADDGVLREGDIGAVIIWPSVTVDKGKTFTTRISKVKVSGEADVRTFYAYLDVDGLTANRAAEGDKLEKDATFYVTKPENELVVFEIDGDTTFEAASLQTVIFKFTAKGTPIRDGKVWFKIPSDWSDPEESDKDELGQVAESDDVTVSSSGRIEIAVEELALNDFVKVTYGGKTKMAEVSDTAATQTIEGMFQAYPGARSRSAGTVEVTITNAEDGSGTATIDPGADESVRAGSVENLIVATFEAAGTMDGGSVSFEPATGWGDLQQDPTKINYIDVQVSGRGAELGVVDYGSRIVVANLMTLPPGGEVEFSYGGGTVDDSNGAQAQSDIGIANFIIKSAGSANGQLKELSGEELTDDDKETNEKALGRVYDSAAGVLKVAVMGASDATGFGDVTVVKSAQSPDGKAIKYVDYADMDEDGDEAEEVDDIRIHAADDNTYLKFVYTPTQTIEDGELKFTVDIDAGWSSPQGTSTGIAGYTRVDKTGADTDLGLATFDTTAGFVTVPIDHIDTAGTIEIHYGAYTTAADGGGASVPKVATLRSPFTISIRGGDGPDNVLGAIRGNADREPLAVRIWSQASGGGSGDITGGDDLSAGDMEAVLTIVYTAAGEIENGMLQLSVPSDKWSAPTIDNFDIRSNGRIDNPDAMDFGGYYTAKEMAPPDDGPSALAVHVGGVSLDAGDTVTFVYTTMVQPAIGDVEFTISVDGGAGPGMAAKAIEDPMGNLTVSVGEAKSGSGKGARDLVNLVKGIKAGDTGVELVFTYIADGEIESRDEEIRVSVPKTWSKPNGADAGDDEEGTYTVTQETLDDEGDYKKLSGNQVTVEKIGPFGQDMAARVKRHKTIGGGDKIIFTYQNADAPRTVGVSTFEVSFGGIGVDNVEVIVQSDAVATALDVDAPAELSADDGEPVAITVMLADSDGNAAAVGTDLVVDLGTSNVDTGSFSDKAGETVATVIIKAGISSAMVYYSDTTVGEATITASTDDLTGTDTIVVTTDMVEITSVDFTIADSDGVAKDVAREGDTITVTALATPGKNLKVTIGAIIPGPGGNINESTDSPGTYTRSDTLASGIPDATYAVTVNFGDDVIRSADDMLTVDNTAPTVTVSDIEEVVANGDTVTISAMVDDGDGSGVDSVMADVSMLDTEADSVELRDADGDGTYTRSYTISDKNGADNGTHTITVTAMDAAGNSSDPVTVMVTLQNSISFTSMVTADVSLFHMPLDDDEIDTVGDLRAALGGDDNVTLLAGVFDSSAGISLTMI